ncbi:MAG TPA: TrmH family RNA methyltransferase [Thermoleophilaceae bacterium]|nr:TrmH family RNA methyltransferase [Thermoleophilaceae bacterium]
MTAAETRDAERFRSGRRDPALAVLEGFHPLKHALRFGARVEVAVAPDPGAVCAAAAGLALDLAGSLASLVRAVDRETFASLGASGPAEVMALARRPDVDVAALLAGGGHVGSDPGGGHVGSDPGGGHPGSPVVLLDNPRHLGNVGAAVRVAAAAGAAGVLVTGQADPWHPVALRGGAGLQFALPVASCASLDGCGRPVVALDPDGDPFAPEAVPAGALLAFGSERRGLSPEVLERAELRLALPMTPGVSSLNLATAVAATLYTTICGGLYRR